MNEVAWCYLEGFGTKKDKVSRAIRPDLSCFCTSGTNRAMSINIVVPTVAVPSIGYAASQPGAGASFRMPL